MINLEFSEHRVLDVRFSSPNLFELVVERNGMEFIPGDCVAIYTDTEKSRPYSIASGTQETELRFLIREMDGGDVSPWLKSRKPGNFIRITPPFGWFRPGQDIGDAPFIFLATGTGISPFLSYLNSFERPPEKCLYGIRKKSEAIGFESLTDFCPTLLAVSREKTGHYHGRITDLLYTLPLDKEAHYYSCGLEGMVNETSKWLQEQGIPFANIHREVFFRD